MSQHNPRGPMRGEFERNGIVIGATRAHVRDLLGPGDDRDESAAPDGSTVDAYALGFPPLRMDTESLHIKYDRNGRVVTMWTVQG